MFSFKNQVASVEDADPDELQPIDPVTLAAAAFETIGDPFSGPATPVTHFTFGKIFNFQWSRDGRLALSRGTETFDVVLIRNFR